MSGGLKTDLGVEFECPHAMHECVELIDKIEILLYSTSNSTLTVIRILHNSIKRIFQRVRKKSASIILNS